jgi:hypothetical protein
MECIEEERFRKESGKGKEVKMADRETERRVKEHVRYG